MDDIERAQQQISDFINYNIGNIKNKINKGVSYKDQIIIDGKIICRACGEPISAERLCVIPHALYCVDCAEEMGM